jgi:hypothetical protein
MERKMKGSAFREKDNAPTDRDVKQILGGAHSLFAQLVAIPRGYAQEWKYYGKNYGWQYKVHDTKKALFYLSPAQGSFLVVLGVREKERERLLASRLPKQIKAEIESAKKHPEGYAVRVIVTDESSFQAAKTILRAVMDMRGSKADK